MKGGGGVRRGRVKRGGGKPERSWQSCLEATQRPARIARCDRGEDLEKNQDLVVHGRLGSREPAKAVTGQKRSQCCTELSPWLHRMQGQSRSLRNGAGEEVKMEGWGLTPRSPRWAVGGRQWRVRGRGKETVNGSRSIG